MLIIWRGLGWLVPILVAVVFIGSQLVLDSLFGEGTYRGDGWPVWLTIAIASICIGVFGWMVNRHQGEGPRPPQHALFFVPVQYWAVLLPLLFGGFQYMDARNQEENALYVTEPQVGDRYLMDFRNAFEDVDPDYPYGAMKVVAVNSTGVKVVLSEYMFELRAGIREALNENKEEGRFNEEANFHFAFEEIEALVASEEIFDVQRF